MNKARQSKMVGSILSMPVFCDNEYNLLLDRQRKHIRWLIDQGIKEGVGVLLIAGGVGETYMLEEDEFKTLAELVVDEAKGETPSMVMIAELSARKAARKARIADDAGVDFILLSPPHYSCPTEDDIFLHHEYVNGSADVGIMLYNSFWVFPAPGYIFSRGLLERLAVLENIEGIKWSTPGIDQWVGTAELFGDRYNFIENARFFSTGAKFGMKGFIDVYGNAAPRLSLHLIDLVRSKRYDEFDKLHRKLRFDPVWGPDGAPPPANTMVADGPNAMMVLESLGLDSGPFFPGQMPPSAENIENNRRVVEASGVMEWVDWDQSILE